MLRKYTVLIERLEASGNDYARYLAQLPQDAIHVAPAPGEWTAHQVAAHMRDTERQVFLARAQRIVKEVHPAVENFDQEAWSRAHYDSHEPLAHILAEFRAARRKLIVVLRQAGPKAWANYAIHSAYDKISLEWLVLHCYHHTLEHVAQMGYAREQDVLRQLNA